MIYQEVVRTDSRAFGGRRRVVPPAGEPRVKTAELIDSASVELWCPRLLSERWDCEGLFLRMWFKKNAEAFLPASVTLGSPSDNTTPRCQRVARGWFFAFSKPSNCCIGYGLIRPDGIASFAHAKAAIPSRRGLSGGAGWPGRGSGFNANSIFRTPRHFQEALKRGHVHRCLFVGTRLHKTGRLIRTDRPGQPEPPGST